MDITPLSKGSIFVFGSNLLGIHGRGAALTAKLLHGAIEGINYGPMGYSYAIPTKNTPRVKMNLDQVKVHVGYFIEYAKRHDYFIFQVTQVGCGLAGHNKEDIAPMFMDAPANCWFDTAWYPILGANRTYWGHA